MSIHQVQLPLCQRAFSQLLIIDAQERLASAMPADEVDLVVGNIKRLVAAAKMLGIPVIATQHNSKGLGPVIQTIREAMPEGAEPTEKTAFSCCTAPGFERSIASHPDRRQLIVVGMEAHICILQTVSGLQRWGYQVFVPADAIISRKLDFKQNILERMRHGGVQVVCTESVGFEWLGDSSDTQFREVWTLFKQTD
ncbi:isochorismatase [Thiocapsa imhoffii]|uniref:Isochorismatase n=1 Tax=Thiocapsa imhoffii TaxID=382777 RepID=A0A9X0WGD4_9GAMM|nr:isochorismatase family protein [Thiocapsa imhoffii]MBK1644234.1 isochorismatase [Thiocapsa imhoffii]